jgi:hypothetical protein
MGVLRVRIVLEDDSAVCTSNDVFKVDSLSSVNVKDVIIVLPTNAVNHRNHDAISRSRSAAQISAVGEKLK